MNNQTTSGFAKHEIYVNEIVFYSKKSISLFGFLHHDAAFLQTEYVITREDLQTLLSQNKTGIEILWHIEKLFVLPHEVPASINLLDLFGMTQIFEAGSIELEHSYYEDENGELHPREDNKLFFIEQVVPFPSARKSSF